MPKTDAPHPPTDSSPDNFPSEACNASDALDQLDKANAVLATAMSGLQVPKKDQVQRNSSTQVLLQEKIRQLENESGEPERREMAKARKKLLREVSATFADKAKAPEEKFMFLEQKIVSLVTEQGKLESELVPLRKKSTLQASALSTLKDELERSNLRSEKLEKLCRTLQAQNKLMAEERQARQNLFERLQEDLGGIGQRLKEQDKNRQLVEEENSMLRERAAVMAEQMALKEDFHARQLRAKDLELELAAVQIKEKEEVVEGLRAQLLASKESEVLLHQQITQQHDKVEEVKATIAKTTEALHMYNENDKKRAAQAKAFEKQMEKREKEYKQMHEQCKIATTFIQTLQAENSMLQKLRTAHDRDITRLSAQKETLEKLARALQQEVRTLKAEAPQEPGGPGSGPEPLLEPPEVQPGVDAEAAVTPSEPAAGSDLGELCEGAVPKSPDSSPEETPGPCDVPPLCYSEHGPSGECWLAGALPPATASQSAELESRSASGVDGGPDSACNVTHGPSDARSGNVTHHPSDIASSGNAARGPSSDAGSAAHALEGAQQRPTEAETPHELHGEGCRTVEAHAECCEADCARTSAGCGRSPGPARKAISGEFVLEEGSTLVLDQASQCAVNVLTSAFGDAFGIEAFMADMETGNRQNAHQLPTCMQSQAAVQSASGP
eukprot:jgi/Botrbrau1/15823/Bobra.40_1s0009.1